MKSFIITLKDHKLSESLSNDCINRAKKYNIEVKKFNAIVGTEYKSHLEKLNIKLHYDVPIQKMSDGYYGCFLSHYYLWLNCVNDNIPYLILEHDGYFIKPLPNDILNKFDDVLKLDLFHPFKSDYDQKVKKGENNIISLSTIKKSNFNKEKSAGFYSAGAYAYIIKPLACKKLIDWINVNGFLPTDNQLGLKVVDIKEPNVTIVRLHPFFSIDDNIHKYSTLKREYNQTSEFSIDNQELL